MHIFETWQENKIKSKELEQQKIFPQIINSQAQGKVKGYKGKIRH